MKEYDLVIIGGGPAGLMAAAVSSLPRVCVVEGEEKPGQKLLLTGKGQCNLTRAGEIGDFLSAYGDNGKFLRNALYGFSNTDVIRFFEDRDCPVLVREDGKVFPRSLKAKDILAVLLDGCREKKVPIFLNSEVLAAQRREGRYCCRTKDETFYARKLLQAAGGNRFSGAGFSSCRLIRPHNRSAETCSCFRSYRSFPPCFLCRYRF